MELLTKWIDFTEQREGSLQLILLSTAKLHFVDCSHLVFIHASDPSDGERGGGTGTHSSDGMAWLSQNFNGTPKKYRSWFSSGRF